jgi:hypothetical protein
MEFSISDLVMLSGTKIVSGVGPQVVIALAWNKATPSLPYAVGGSMETLLRLQSAMELGVRKIKWNSRTPDAQAQDGFPSCLGLAS